MWLTSKLTPVSQNEFDIRSLASIAGELDHSAPVNTIQDSACLRWPSNPESYWESIREEAAPAIDDEGVIRHVPDGQKHLSEQDLVLITSTVSFRYRRYAVLLTKYSLAVRYVRYGEAFAGEKFKPDVYAAYVAAIDQNNRARPLTAEESAALWDTLRKERVTYQVLFDGSETTQERRVTILRPEVGPKEGWAEKIRNLSATNANRGHFKNTKLLGIRPDTDEEEFPDSLDHLAAEIALTQSANTHVREMSLSFADVRQAIEQRSRLVTSQEEAMKLFQPFITKNGEIAITAATARCAKDLINSFFALQADALGVIGLVLIDAKYSVFRATGKVSKHRTYLCKKDSEGLYRPLSAAEKEHVLNGIEEYIWSTDQIYQLYEELKNLL